MAVNTALIKELMSLSGAGMMDCKKTLEEAGGDLDEAVKILREKGKANQEKKAGRAAAEGLVAVTVEGNKGAIIEVNSETDFVAKNEEFRAFVQNAAKSALAASPADLDALMQASMVGTEFTVEGALQELFLKIRENLKVRRFKLMDGTLFTYIHNNGEIGVMVNFKTDIDPTNPALVECGKNVAMQIAALGALYLRDTDVPQEKIDSEKEIAMAQLAEDPKNANKPDAVKAKIAEGKLKKFFSECVLLNQAYVKDDKLTVAQYIAGVAKELGGNIEITEYVRYQKGEGLEKKADNFAEEVAQLAKGG
ncbi:MAG: translation elongation factor Ts [Ruminococcus sp.]|jgi:elongation factor Ts|nr:translation elongation factor Ts [Ruminococcus sp.]